MVATLRLILCGAFLFCPGLIAQAQASGGELIPEQAVFDVQHYDLRLRVDPAEQTIAGSLLMRARMLAAAERLALDLDQRLTVEAVVYRGAPAAFTHRDGRIWIELPEPAQQDREIEVLVRYGGRPRVAPRPPWDGGFTWAQSGDGSPWIATSCQGEGADLWWPCKDHPSDKPAGMDLRITVPDELFCASNGTLQSDVTNRDGTRTLHWKIASPISNYAVALNIAPYAVIETSYASLAGDTVPVFFWVLPENRDKAEAALPEFLDHLRFFEEVCGPYPFRHEKYGIVETPHLGMEHQTVIAYGNGFQQGQFDYDWLHNHELAHEWWGNLVTCRDWKDMWIHEGIGTYMQALYLESRRGPEAYRQEMADKRRSLGNRRAVAPRESMNSKEIYFDRDGRSDNDIYYKGSWVMHTLRWLVGDEKFFEVLRRLAYPDPESEKVTDGSQVRLVDTEDIRAIAERVSGRELGWFFEIYLRQAELPGLEVARRGGELRLRWNTPGDLPFPMPVPVRIGGELRRVEVGEGGATVDLAGLDFEVDPDHRILKKL